MNNDKENSTSVDIDGSVVEHDQSKRKILKTVAGGTVAAGAVLSHKQWVDPVIKTVVLPAHAQMSEDMEDDDTAGGAITVSLACTEVSSTAATNGQALGDIDITVNATIAATLLTGDAGSDLSGIPVTVTISSSIIRDADPIGNALPAVANPDAVVNGVTNGDGEFVLTAYQDSNLNYLASQFMQPALRFEANLTLTVTSSDSRVTSIGPVCSCAKSKTTITDGNGNNFICS